MILPIYGIHLYLIFQLMNWSDTQACIGAVNVGLFMQAWFSVQFVWKKYSSFSKPM